MSAPDRTLISTSRGDVRCVHVDGVAAYRVGYSPTSWAPWEFATDGRFTGSGTIGGWFVVPGDPESVATLRTLSGPMRSDTVCSTSTPRRSAMPARVP
ncbi:hypothetical protein [Rhodococcus pyridinivorans]